MGYKYAYQGSEENVAKAVITNVAISTKSAAMIAQFIRGKTVERAERDLQEVLGYKQAVPFTRYTDGAGHKKKLGPGKYPQKATKTFLSLLNSAVKNAEDLGLSDDLIIVGCTAQQASRTHSPGRWRGRQTKSTHVEMVVAEQGGEE
jgi:large subunit ribosomal protein L22